MARLFSLIERTWYWHPRLSHIRRTRRHPRRSQSCLQRHALAALSVPSPAKRTGLRAQARHARNPSPPTYAPVFNAAPLRTQKQQLDILIEKYSKSAPELSNWMQTAIPEGLEVFNLPEHKRGRLRTSNACENLNTQIKRRTKVAGLFPNTDSISQALNRNTHGSLRRMGDRQSLYQHQELNSPVKRNNNQALSS